MSISNGTSSYPADAVLIVDDDVEARHVLCLLFESEGFRVAEASNGVEAVAHSLREPHRFIVLDDPPAGALGEKIVPLLRGLEPEARIVAFSSHSGEKPDWADAFLNRERIIEVSPLLTDLTAIRIDGTS